MINSLQQPQYTLGSSKRKSQASRRRHLKACSFNYISQKSLENNIFSFQQLQPFQQEEDVEQQLNNFKKYLYDSTPIQEKSKDYRRKAEMPQLSRYIADSQTVSLRKKLEDKIKQAHQKLEEMKEGLRKHQEIKSAIIQQSDMRRSFMKASIIK